MTCDPLYLFIFYLGFREGDPTQAGFELSLELLQAQSLLPVAKKKKKRHMNHIQVCLPDMFHQHTVFI